MKQRLKVVLNQFQSLKHGLLLIGMCEQITFLQSNKGGFRIVSTQIL